MPPQADEASAGVLATWLGSEGPDRGSARIVVDYPHDGSVFPPGMVPPTFLWHDDHPETDLWIVTIAFGGRAAALAAVVPGSAPPEGEIDPEAMGKTNELYVPTPYQASAHAWTPSVGVWAAIQAATSAPDAAAEVTFHGIRASAPTRPLSSGAMTLSTSADPVDGPIFYRDVPLIPAVFEEEGTIKPLPGSALPIIAWRLRDITKPDSRVVLKRITTCANCHSFSQDGSTLGMDIDGSTGDKGTYTILPISQHMVVDEDAVLTWNSFEDKPEGHKTIGFLSRISPDGSHAATTLNEEVFVQNFANHRFLQVFYPTRGILGIYSVEDETIRALPGADDPAYVHCSPVWTPDGETIVFARAEAFDPYWEGQVLPEEPNDPNEPRIRYSLYRIPFADGQGGTPEPIEGASHNGMSNTFPKVSPDGKWLVFTKCRNGLLMRPDSRLWIVPAEGGEAREMACNTSLMNSWHSWSPNSRWLVFSSKVNTPYTQMFLTHVDEGGNSTPPILIPNSTAANRAVNIPEFVNIDYDDLQRIEVPLVRHNTWMWDGMDLLAQGKPEAARPLLDRALEMDRDLVPALVARGYVHLAEDEPEEAARRFRRALELEPDYPYANNGLGWVLLRRGEVKPSVEYFRRALRVFPDYLEAHKNAGFALLQLGDLPGALRHYELARKIDERDRVSLGSIAHILLRLGREEEARARLEALVRLAPDDADARVSLAWLLATAADGAVRNGPRAVELAETVARHAAVPRVVGLDVLAAAQAEAGNYEAARRSAKEALALPDVEASGRADGLRTRLGLYDAGRPFHQRGQGP
jgi:tetratricopeptide (TPR) repeat protein